MIRHALEVVGCLAALVAVGAGSHWRRLYVEDRRAAAADYLDPDVTCVDCGHRFDLYYAPEDCDCGCHGEQYSGLDELTAAGWLSEVREAVVSDWTLGDARALADDLAAEWVQGCRVCGKDHDSEPADSDPGWYKRVMAEVVREAERAAELASMLDDMLARQPYADVSWLDTAPPGRRYLRSLALTAAGMS